MSTAEDRADDARVDYELTVLHQTGRCNSDTCPDCIEEAFGWLDAIAAVPPSPTRHLKDTA